MDGNDDLRTALTAAFAEQRVTDEPAEVTAAVTPPAPPDPKPPDEAAAPATPERPRDERGRFASGAEKLGGETTSSSPQGALVVGAAEPATPAVPSAAAPAAPAPPNGWSAEAKAKWHELPLEIQAAVAKREQDVHKLAGKQDEERSFGREIQRVVQPYLAQIHAEGGTPAGAIQSLLNTAYVLRNGSPQQKAQALAGVAQQFGVDMAGVQAGQPSQHAPEVQALLNRIDQLERQMSLSSETSRVAAQQEIAQDVEAFKADPAHVHFEDVKGHMAALLSSGAAKDLKSAYDAACWARPDIRATLQAQERAAAEAKRRADETRRLEEAKRKAVSVVGAPGIAVPNAPANAGRSLRDELAANFTAARANGAV